MQDKNFFNNDALYKLRKEKGLSQEELSSKINVSRQMISYWETGANVPEIENISKLCKEFNIPIDTLLPNITENKIENNNKIENDQEKNTEKRKRKVKKQIIKYISIALLLFLISYLIFIVYRLNIILDINNKNDILNNPDNLDNFSYTQTTISYDILDSTNSKLEKISYTLANNILKINIDTTESLEIYYNFNQNIQYSFNNTYMTYSIKNEISEEDYSIVSNTSSYLKVDNIFIAFIASANPTTSISKVGDTYNIEYTSNGMYEILCTEIIDIETGFIQIQNQISQYNQITTFYEHSIGDILDEDVSLPDLTLYTLNN